MRKDRHHSRLWTGIAAFLHEAHRGTQLQLFELSRSNAVPVEIQCSAIAGLDTPVSRKRIELGDAAGGGFVVSLDVVSAYSLEIFELTADGSERVSNCDVHVLMTLPFAVLFSGHNLPVGNRQIHVDFVPLPLALVLMRRFDDDTAAHDRRAESLQSLRHRPHAFLDCRRMLHMAKSDL